MKSSVTHKPPMIVKCCLFGVPKRNFIFRPPGVALMKPMWWLYSFLYMLFGLLMAQQIVVRTSGMKYSDFLFPEKCSECFVWEQKVKWSIDNPTE